MEKMTYQNSIGQQIIFSESSKYRWLQVSDLGGLESIQQITSSPYQDGVSAVGSSYFQSRIVSVDFVIVDPDPVDAMRNLNSVLNPKIGIGKLIVEIDGNKKVFDKVKVRIMPTKLGGESRGYGFQFTSVVFEVFDPVYSDFAYTEAEVGTGELYLGFPINITDTFVFDAVFTDGVLVYNVGDVETPVEVILDGVVLAPLVIENLTTGGKIVIGLDILVGERLIITTELDNINVVLVDTISGTESVAFQYIDIEQTEFFYLAKGENQIAISGVEGEVESAIVKFKNRYVGV